jgi:hypothetical protein
MSTPQTRFDISDISEPPQRAPRTRPASSQPATVNPQLDSFVNDVITEASKRTGYTYRLGSGVRSPEEQAQKVAQGYSKTYDSKHLGGNARDVLAFDANGNYITDGSHPAYQTLGAVYREKVAAAPIPVKWGGDFQSFHDPGHFELGAAASAAPKFDISDLAEPDSKFDLSDIAEPDDGDVVRVNADPKAPDTPLAPLPERQVFDPHTAEGMQARDTRSAMEHQPNAYLEMAVPLNGDEPSKVTGDELMRRGIYQWAQTKGIPTAFVEKWISGNAPQGYSLRNKSGTELQSAADAVSPDSYDLKSGTLRVKLNSAHLSKLADDYEASKGIVSRAADALTDPERSAGENALYVADKAGRVVNALTAAEWSQLRGAGMGSKYGVEINPKGEAAMLAALEGEEVPEYARNPVGEAARNSQTLRDINPHLPAVAGFAGDMVDPLMFLPVGELTGLAKGGEVAADAMRPLGLEAARGAEVAGMEARLGRVLEVTRRLRAGETLTPEESALADEIRAKYRSAPKADPDSLAYARERQRFYTEEAQSAKTAAARQNAQANADAYAADIARMEAGGRQPGAGGAQSGEQASAYPAPAVAEQMPALARLGAFHVRNGTRDFGEWSRAMTEDLGEGIRPHLPEIHDATHSGLYDTGTPTPEPQPPPAPTTARGVAARVVNTASDIINAPKSIKSSLALHGPFRQGAFQAAAHPTFLKDAIANQVKAFASEDAFRDFAQSVTARPWYGPMTDAGLFLPSTYDAAGEAGTGALMREERFASQAAEKIPGVRASGRAYLAAMDTIRSQAVETYLTDMFGSAEADLTKADPRALKAIAEMVNVTTGRGVFPILDRSATGRKIVAALNNPFWSPRAMASRFNVLSPYRLATNAANPATRGVALLQLRDSMRALTTLGATLGLLSLVPGVEVGLNPYKPNWGKVSVGDTHYDLVDGIPATARFAAQMSSSFYLKAEGKRLKRGQDPYSLADDFLRRRLSPSGKVAADAITGRTVEGEPFTYSGAARDLLLQFTVEGMYDGWKSAGGSSVNDALDGNKEFRTGFKGAAKGLPGFFGIPSSVYKGRDGAQTQDSATQGISPRVESEP